MIRIFGWWVMFVFIFFIIVLFVFLYLIEVCKNF